MTEPFNTKSRKKAFDKVFKERIVPFFESRGFARHTKTSKRLFKDFENKLSAFIFFDYKSFGYGFYDITISYFDTDFGAVLDDEYIALAKIKTPSISGNTVEELNLSVSDWLLIIEAEIVPFIEQHSTHKAILESNQFYFPKAREDQFREFLRSKADL